MVAYLLFPFDAKFGRCCFPARGFNPAYASFSAWPLGRYPNISRNISRKDEEQKTTTGAGQTPKNRAARKTARHDNDTMGIGRNRPFW
jgi:hypothetical protein